MFIPPRIASEKRTARTVSARTQSMGGAQGESEV